MTAQHAVRQGRLAADSIAASFGDGERRHYKHHDLGLLVDLAGRDAVANPLGLPLAGLPAKAVTSGYHLLSIPGNRIRVGSDWLLDALLPRQVVQTGLVTAAAVPPDSAPAEPSGPASHQRPARRRKPGEVVPGLRVSVVVEARRRSSDGVAGAPGGAWPGTGAASSTEGRWCRRPP
jgi:hypothetical protein